MSMGRTKVLNGWWFVTAWASLVVALFASPTLAQTPAATTATSNTAVTSRGTLRLAPCHLRGVATTSMCGVLTRPLDPAQPSGAAIDIHVAVLTAVARNKRPDPVFFLAGGPGQSAIDLAGPISTMLSRFGNRRDIVLVDQRGTGRSARLACDPPDPWQPLVEASNTTRAIERLKACATKLKALPHGDTRHYTTTVAMQDLDAVREALGASTINLMGASYGTRAALEYMRHFPSRVRSAVLDGVAPPDMVMPSAFSIDNQAALDQTITACEQDAACDKRYPKLGVQWQALMASLPQTVSVRHPATGLPETLTLTRDMLASLVRWPLYVPSMTAMLPFAIVEARAGRFETLMALGGAMQSRKNEAMADGMHFAVVCAEDAPRMNAASDATSRDFGDSMASVYRAVCPLWPKAEVPSAFYTVPATPIATLLLSGGADPATPPRHAERVAKLLGPHAQHVVVPNAGHGTMALPCLRELIFDFVNKAELGVAAGAKDRAKAEGSTVDASCVKDTPRATPYVPPRPRESATPPAKLSRVAPARDDHHEARAYLPESRVTL